MTKSKCIRHLILVICGPPLLFLLVETSAARPRADNPDSKQTSYESLVPFITHQVYANARILCIVNNDERLPGIDPDSYSLFLISKGSVLDSFSLESNGVYGPSLPKSLFIWKTSNENIGCLEFLSGTNSSAGGEYYTILMLFKFSGANIILLSDSSTTNELYENNRENKYWETEGRIEPFNDTLFVSQTHWKETKRYTGHKLRRTKEMVGETTTKLVWDGHRIQQSAFKGSIHASSIPKE